ncbi:MAG: hypothetical protein ACR2IE_07750 [Candidatus Sumerlaeaceae bacterium]
MRRLRVLVLVQIPNRRFRGDEFLVPLKLTRGRDAIRLKVQCRPMIHPLLPG